MVLFNHATRELTAKIVYYGPGLCGKTTNLKVLHERLEQGTTGRLLSLSTAQDRTIYFDLLPVELGNIKGYTVRFQLCTVPGQVFYNETRKLVLRGVDGLVFVVDSQWSMLSHNLESFQNLKENLKEVGANLESLPVVIQYNKRDINGVLPVETLQESLAFQNYPFVEAVASEGKGVVESFKLVSKLTFVDLLRRLQKTGGLEDTAPSPGEAPDPGEETMVRAHRLEKKSSFVDAAIRTAEPFASAEGSPFDTSGWNPPAGEVFDGGTPLPGRDEPFAAAAPGSPLASSSPFDAVAREGPALAVDVATPPPTPVLPAPPPQTAPAAAGAGESADIAELKAKVEELSARAASLAETVASLSNDGSRNEALEAMRERVDGLVGVMRHEISQRLDPASRSLSELKNAFEASVSRQNDAVTELRHAIPKEIAAALEVRDAKESAPSPAVDRLREQVASLLAEEQDKLEAKLQETEKSLRADLEKSEAKNAEAAAEIAKLRNDLESATNGLRLELTSLLGKNADEAAASRESFARELEAMRSAVDGAVSGEREARNALAGKISLFEGALDRLRTESDAAHSRAHERIFAAEERARKLSEAIRKAFES